MLRSRVEQSTERAQPGRGWSGQPLKLLVIGIQSPPSPAPLQETIGDAGRAAPRYAARGPEMERETACGERKGRERRLEARWEAAQPRHGPGTAPARPGETVPRDRAQSEEMLFKERARTTRTGSPSRDRPRSGAWRCAGCALRVYFFTFFPLLETSGSRLQTHPQTDKQQGRICIRSAKKRASSAVKDRRYASLIGSSSFPPRETSAMAALLEGSGARRAGGGEAWARPWPARPSATHAPTRRPRLRWHRAAGPPGPGQGRRQGGGGCAE